MSPFDIIAGLAFAGLAVVALSFAVADRALNGGE